MKKLLSPFKKSAKNKNVFLSGIMTSVVMIVCCAICLTGVTWAWWTANASVLTEEIKTAYFDTKVVVTYEDQDGTIVELAPVDGKYEFEKNIRYTVTISITDDTTATKGFATFKVEGEEYHTVQLGYGDTNPDSISFDILNYEDFETGDSNWGTSSLDDHVFDGDLRFIRDSVKLVPKNAESTAMIERDGVVETWNTNLGATPVGVNRIMEPDADMSRYNPDNFESYYIYGLTTNMGADNVKLDDYIMVTGGGYYTLTLSESGQCGTGAVVKVYTPDDELVEQFYIIIFGDVDGDSFITGSDSTMIKAEVNKRDWSKTETKVNYMCKAADVDGDTFVTGSDSTSIKAVVNRKQTVNQKTGLSS